MAKTSKRSSNKKLAERTGDVWNARLSLRRSHLNTLEDIAHEARRAGTHHRPTLSDLVMGVLDATLPVLADADFRLLSVSTKDMKLAQSRSATRTWVCEVLVERLRQCR